MMTNRMKQAASDVRVDDHHQLKMVLLDSDE
jgi:hypothetical protein